MTGQPTGAPSAAAERITCVDDLAGLIDYEIMAEIDRLRVTHAEFSRFVQEAQDMRKERDAARARADGYALLVGEYRAALVEHVEYDDGTFTRSFSRCMVCCEDDRASGSLEHNPICILAADPEPRAQQLSEAARGMERAIRTWLDDPSVDATQEETDLLGEAYGYWVNAVAGTGGRS